MSIAIRPTKESQECRPTIGTARDEDPISIDIDLLIGTRMLIQANSGGGKTWALRRLLEQTHGRVQHIVLDPEGDFHTLRTDFDYVLAAPREGDCVATPETAELLARRLLELEASAIIDIFDLPLSERRQFVRLFLESLIEAPRDLWHSVLIVLDEAQVFAPQNGRAESTQAVIDLMTRGRKRGQSGMLVTQRISALHKDAAAECNNKMIGRSVLDVDTKRAADELGFRSRAQQQSLRSLKPGEFYAFGPALCEQVKRIMVGRVVTQHKEPGTVSPPMTPPPESVKAALSKLADLPRAAEEESTSREALRQRVRELEDECKRRAAPGAKIVEQLRRTEASAEQWKTRHEELLAVVGETGEEISRALGSVEDSVVHAKSTLSRILRGAVDLHSPGTVESDDAATDDAAQPGAPFDGHGDGLRGGMARIVRALADRHPQRFAARDVAVLAQMAPTSGTFQAYISRLQSRGLIDRRCGSLGCTQAGIEAAEVLPAGPEANELVDAWCRLVGAGAAGRLLDFLASRHPQAISRSELAAQCGLTSNGGTYSSYLAALRNRGLISETLGGIQAAPILFEPVAIRGRFAVDGVEKGEGVAPLRTDGCSEGSDGIR